MLTAGDVKNFYADSPWERQYVARAYLDRLPPWDYEIRTERLFNMVFGAEDTQLNRAAAKAWMIGAVRRAYQHGAHHDWLPILWCDGQVECPDTAPLLESLVPEFLREHCYRRLPSPLRGTANQRRKAIGDAAWLVQYDHLGKHRISPNIRGWVDETSVNFNFERHPVTQHRNWVPIVIMNEDPRPLLAKDTSGSRRFLSIECMEEINDYHSRNWLESSREQLWAEAKHWCKSAGGLTRGSHDWFGENKLPGHLQKARDKANTVQLAAI